ncbi:MAG: cystathionine beta-lyase [Pseudomonadota bacterium]
MSKSDRASSNSKMKFDTQLAHLGRRPTVKGGHAVNVPVVHASTILFDSVEQMKEATQNRSDPNWIHYGRGGTQTHIALQESVAELEGAHAALCVPSGLAAVVVSILSQVQAGDHLLVADSVYAPTRGFCEGFLKKFGVETDYYNPLDIDDLRSKFRTETRVVYTEAPGSLTFEMQDIPAISEVAHTHGAKVILDNTWATPMYFKSFAHGVDISVHAGTKYIVGHSDAMLGLVLTSDETTAAVQRQADLLGYACGPDDIYLALRGLRTLSVRLERHQKNALALCNWLSQRREVARLFYPALPEDPGHELWKRDFLGASGLFGVELHPVSDDAVGAFLNSLKLFGMGYSWGGYESLAIPTKPSDYRTATQWDGHGPTLRLHAGLEDADDLIQDLEQAFAQLRAAS